MPQNAEQGVVRKIRKCESAWAYVARHRSSVRAGRFWCGQAGQGACDGQRREGRRVEGVCCAAQHATPAGLRRCGGELQRVSQEPGCGGVEGRVDRVENRRWQEQLDGDVGVGRGDAAQHARAAHSSPLQGMMRGSGGKKSAGKSAAGAPG